MVNKESRHTVPALCFKELIMFNFISIALGFFDISSPFGIIFWSFVGLFLLALFLKPVFHKGV